MRGAIIEDGLVANVVELEKAEDWPGAVICGPEVSRGWLYDGIAFSPPPVLPPPVPSSVTPLQIRRALLQQGLLDDVQAFVEASDLETRMAWEYAVEILRDDPMLTAAAAALGKTDAEVDDLFRLAATL